MSPGNAHVSLYRKQVIHFCICWQLLSCTSLTLDTFINVFIGDKMIKLQWIITKMLTDISQFKVWYVLYIWIRWCHLINNNAIDACTFLQLQYISVPIARSIYHDPTYGTVITVAESESDFRITTDTPYLALTGMLWGVYGESLEKINRL